MDGCLPGVGGTLTLGNGTPSLARVGEGEGAREEEARLPGLGIEMRNGSDTRRWRSNTGGASSTSIASSVVIVSGSHGTVTVKAGGAGCKREEEEARGDLRPFPRRS